MLASSSLTIALWKSPTSGANSSIRPSRSDAMSIVRWRTAAGSSIVRAIVDAVSDSMLSLTKYCSMATS